MGARPTSVRAGRRGTVGPEVQAGAGCVPAAGPCLRVAVLAAWQIRAVLRRIRAVLSPALCRAQWGRRTSVGSPPVWRWNSRAKCPPLR